MLTCICVGDGGKWEGENPLPPKKNREEYFSDKYRVKFGHFVNFYSSRAACDRPLIRKQESLANANVKRATALHV